MLMVSYFKAFKLLLIVSIFATVSASFLRSTVITCAGAFATKRSLESFFAIPNKKPSALFSSASNFLTSASTSIFSLEIGTKYSLDFTLNEAPSIFSVTVFIIEVFVGLVNNSIKFL